MGLGGGDEVGCICAFLVFVLGITLLCFISSFIFDSLSFFTTKTTTTPTNDNGDPLQ